MPFLCHSFRCRRTLATRAVGPRERRLLGCPDYLPSFGGVGDLPGFDGGIEDLPRVGPRAGGDGQGGGRAGASPQGANRLPRKAAGGTLPAQRSGGEDRGEDEQGRILDRAGVQFPWGRRDRSTHRRGGGAVINSEGGS